MNAASAAIVGAAKVVLEHGYDPEELACICGFPCLLPHHAVHVALLLRGGRAIGLFLAVDAFNTPGIWSEQSEGDPAPVLVIERTDVNADGFDLLAALVTDWRCEDWR